MIEARTYYRVFCDEPECEATDYYDDPPVYDTAAAAEKAWTDWAQALALPGGGVAHYCEDHAREGQPLPQPLPGEAPLFDVSESGDTCTHCGEPVKPTDGGDWIHGHGRYRCQSPNVAYGHLSHPESVPCRADGPNPCLGATGPGGSVTVSRDEIERLPPNVLDVIHAARARAEAGGSDA